MSASALPSSPPAPDDVPLDLDAFEAAARAAIAALEALLADERQGAGAALAAAVASASAALDGSAGVAGTGTATADHARTPPVDAPTVSTGTVFALPGALSFDGSSHPHPHPTGGALRAAPRGPHAAHPLEDDALLDRVLGRLADGEAGGALVDRLLPGTRDRLLRAAGLATLDALAPLRFGRPSLRLRIAGVDCLPDPRRSLSGRLPPGAALADVEGPFLQHASPPRAAGTPPRPPVTLPLPLQDLLAAPARTVARAVRERWRLELDRQLDRLARRFLAHRGRDVSHAPALRDALAGTAAWARLRSGWRLVFDGPGNRTLQQALSTGSDHAAVRRARALFGAPTAPMLLAVLAAGEALDAAFDTAPGLAAVDVPLAWADDACPPDVFDAVRRAVADGLDESTRECLRAASPRLLMALVRCTAEAAIRAIDGQDAFLPRAASQGAALALGLARCARGGMLPPVALVESAGFRRRQAERSADGRALALARGLLDETLLWQALAAAGGMPAGPALACLDGLQAADIDESSIAQTADWLLMRDRRDRRLPREAARLRQRLILPLLPALSAAGTDWRPLRARAIHEPGHWRLGTARGRMRDAHQRNPWSDVDVDVLPGGYPAAVPDSVQAFAPVRRTELVVRVRCIPPPRDDAPSPASLRALAEAVALRLEGLIARHPSLAAPLLRQPGLLADRPLSGRMLRDLPAAWRVALHDGDAATIAALAGCLPDPLAPDARGRTVLDAAVDTLRAGPLRALLDALSPRAARHPDAWTTLLRRATEGVLERGDAVMLRVMADAGCRVAIDDGIRADWHPRRRVVRDDA